MTRYLCWLALFGVVALPDWANACWFRWWGQHPAYVQPSYPVYPAYPAPVYPSYPVCVPPPVYVCPPAPSYPLPPPRVERTPRMANPAPAPAPPSGVGTATPKPTRPPAVETVRPASGSDTISPQVMPASPVPMPKKAEPPKVAPEPTAKPAEAAAPKDEGALPKLDVPKDENFRPVPNPKDAVPALPPVPGTGDTAVPSPAPAMPEPLIPSPSVPALPDPKKPADLPSLTLPPDSPILPQKKSTSRSSPLTGGEADPKAEVFAASGGGNLAGGYKTVGFYNHTDRDLNLVIEGRSVKLPAKSYLNAQLGPTFTWGHANGTATRETVPPGASGLDVVFRE
jgi:hypothetical protein